MAATNFTPIQLYHSTTASAAPVAGNLANGELAINITDGKLFYKDNGGTVQVLATKGTGTIGGSNTQVQYNSGGALAGSANFTFNGTTATINTLNLTNALGTTYGGTGLNSYTTGDIVYASASNTLSKLTIGTNGYILTSNGSIPTWTAGSSISVNTADNLSGGAAGSVPYQSGPGATTFLSIGTANRVLTSSGTAPQWVNSLTGLTGVSSSGLTNTSLTSGRVVYSTAGGAQTDSASLTFNGTTLTAAGLASTGASTLDKLVKIGDTAFNLPSVLSATAPAKLYVSTATVTDASSAAGATNVLGTIASLGSTTVAASNTGVTYTNLATLYIAGAPTAGTNVTITNPYSLYIAAGAAYFGGGLTFAGQLNVTNTTDASSTSTGSIVTAGGVGIAKSLWVGLDANIYGITVGRGAGAVSTNTALGASALAANTTGAFNTAVGTSALVSNTTGGYNTALGRTALTSNTTGGENTGLGANALQSNTTGGNNIAVGGYSLVTNSTGNYNTAVGWGSLWFNTTASSNTAVGYQSLYANTTGAANTAIGQQALAANTTASYNVAVGYAAGLSNQTGGESVFVGFNAGQQTTAGGNTFVGFVAAQNTTSGVQNSGFGSYALYTNTTGSFNTALGRQALYSNTTASNNVAVGYQAAYSKTTGSSNTAVGYQALYTDGGGTYNTALGYQALKNQTGADYNTAVGTSALLSNTTGNFNTAVGYLAMRDNTTGGQNTAVGIQSLVFNTTGANNVAVGVDALQKNTTASNNTAVGHQSAYNNTTGDYNTAVGTTALFSNTTGYNNTAVGYQAAYSNTGGVENTAVGRQALRANTSGNYNTAFGIYALYNATTADANTAVGRYAGQAITTGTENTLMGNATGQGLTTGVDNTMIGEQAGYYTTTANYNTFIGRLAGQSVTTGGGNTFLGRGSGQLMTTGTFNTILGRFNGNQGGLDIRTASNRVVLSDGDGNPFYFGLAPSTHYISIPASGSTYRQSVSYQTTLFLTNPVIGIWGSVQSRAELTWLAQNCWVDTDTVLKNINGGGKRGMHAGFAGNVFSVESSSNRTNAGEDISGDMVSMIAVSRDSTVSLQGASVQSGTGITFPATQNASSNANTLDDYEEGSFTLTLADSSGNNATMGGNNVWRYVKIGRTVTIAGTLDWTDTSALTAGSRIRLNGLPFTSDGSNANIRTACATGSSSSGSCNIPTAQVKFGIDGGNTFIWGTNAGGNNVDTIMVKADLANSGTIYGVVCTYLASA